jgi:hypothetical protein
MMTPVRPLARIVPLYYVACRRGRSLRCRYSIEDQCVIIGISTLPLSIFRLAQFKLLDLRHIRQLSSKRCGWVRICDLFPISDFLIQHPQHEDTYLQHLKVPNTIKPKRLRIVVQVPNRRRIISRIQYRNSLISDRYTRDMLELRLEQRVIEI